MATYKIKHEKISFFGNWDWIWNAYKKEYIFGIPYWEKIYGIMEETREECEASLQTYVCKQDAYEKKLAQQKKEEYIVEI